MLDTSEFWLRDDSLSNKLRKNNAIYAKQSYYYSVSSYSQQYTNQLRKGNTTYKSVTLSGISSGIAVRLRLTQLAFTSLLVRQHTHGPHLPCIGENPQHCVLSMLIINAKYTAINVHNIAMLKLYSLFSHDWVYCHSILFLMCQVSYANQNNCYI